MILKEWFVAIEEEDGEFYIPVVYGRIDSSTLASTSTSTFIPTTFTHLTRHVILTRLDEIHFLTPEGREVELSGPYDLERAKLAGVAGYFIGGFKNGIPPAYLLLVGTAPAIIEAARTTVTLAPMKSPTPKVRPPEAKFFDPNEIYDVEAHLHPTADTPLPHSWVPMCPPGRVDIRRPGGPRTYGEYWAEKRLKESIKVEEVEVKAVPWTRYVSRDDDYDPGVETVYESSDEEDEKVVVEREKEKGKETEKEKEKEQASDSTIAAPNEVEGVPQPTTKLIESSSTSILSATAAASRLPPTSSQPIASTSRLPFVSRLAQSRLPPKNPLSVANLSSHNSNLARNPQTNSNSTIIVIDNSSDEDEVPAKKVTMSTVVLDGVVDEEVVVGSNISVDNVSDSGNQKELPLDLPEEEQTNEGEKDVSIVSNKVMEKVIVVEEEEEEEEEQVVIASVSANGVQTGLISSKDFSPVKNVIYSDTAAFFKSPSPPPLGTMCDPNASSPIPVREGVEPLTALGFAGLYADSDHSDTQNEAQEMFEFVNADVQGLGRAQEDTRYGGVRRREESYEVEKEPAETERLIKELIQHETGGLDVVREEQEVEPNPISDDEEFIPRRDSIEVELEDTPQNRAQVEEEIVVAPSSPKEVSPSPSPPQSLPSQIAIETSNDPQEPVKAPELLKSEVEEPKVEEPEVVEPEVVEPEVVEEQSDREVDDSEEDEETRQLLLPSFSVQSDKSSTPSIRESTPPPPIASSLKGAGTSTSKTKSVTKTPTTDFVIEFEMKKVVKRKMSNSQAKSNKSTTRISTSQEASSPRRNEDEIIPPLEVTEEKVVAAREVSIDQPEVSNPDVINYQQTRPSRPPSSNLPTSARSNSVPITTSAGLYHERAIVDRPPILPASSSSLHSILRPPTQLVESRPIILPQRVDRPLLVREVVVYTKEINQAGESSRSVVIEEEEESEEEEEEEVQPRRHRKTKPRRIQDSPEPTATPEVDRRANNSPSVAGEEEEEEEYDEEEEEEEEEEEQLEKSRFSTSSKGKGREVLSNRRSQSVTVPTLEEPDAFHMDDEYGGGGGGEDYSDEEERLGSKKNDDEDEESEEEEAEAEVELEDDEDNEGSNEMDDQEEDDEEEEEEEVVGRRRKSKVSTRISSLTQKTLQQNRRRSSKGTSTSIAPLSPSSNPPSSHTQHSSPVNTRPRVHFSSKSQSIKQTIKSKSQSNSQSQPTSKYRSTSFQKIIQASRSGASSNSVLPSTSRSKTYNQQTSKTTSARTSTSSSRTSISTQRTSIGGRPTRMLKTPGSWWEAGTKLENMSERKVSMGFDPTSGGGSNSLKRENSSEEENSLSEVEGGQEEEEDRDQDDGEKDEEEEEDQDQESTNDRDIAYQEEEDREEVEEEEEEEEAEEEKVVPIRRGRGRPLASFRPKRANPGTPRSTSVPTPIAVRPVVPRPVVPSLPRGRRRISEVDQLSLVWQTKKREPIVSSSSSGKKQKVVHPNSDQVRKRS